MPWQWYIENGHLQRRDLGFSTAADMGGEYTLAATDQRHRAVFNGIWEAPYGLQLSGVYFYGSELRFGASHRWGQTLVMGRLRALRRNVTGV